MLTPSNQYLQAVEEINDYVNQAKCRASVSVNSEIMKTNIFIWNVIIRNSEWGNKFVENLSKDMKMRVPSAKSYSVRNLKYVCRELKAMNVTIDFNKLFWGETHGYRIILKRGNKS